MFRKLSLIVAAATLAISVTAVAGSYNAKKDIVDTAVSVSDFSTLVTAVQAAGLVDTLKGDGPFTVFAPTNEAFSALPDGTLESLLKPENRDMLVSVLTYHVVAGEVTSDQVVKLTEATTVQGDNIDIKTQYGKVMIDGATVTQADIKTSNGVIHVIDKVILPAS